MFDVFFLSVPFQSFSFSVLHASLFHYISSGCVVDREGYKARILHHGSGNACVYRGKVDGNAQILQMTSKSFAVCLYTKN